MLPPRVWGLIPRLAAQMRIEKVRAIFSQEADQGLMLSMELLDCEATGFQDEPGNFICRSAVPQKRVTTRATCTRRFQEEMRSAMNSSGAMGIIAVVGFQEDSQLTDSHGLDFQGCRSMCW